MLSEPAQQAKSPSEELIDGIISLIARYESKIRLVRIRRGMNLAIGSGKHPGKAPLGYSNTPDGLVPNQDAALVRDLLERHALGESIYSLSRQADFNPSKVHYILNNPVYIGRIRWRDKLLKGQHQPIISTQLWDRVHGKKHAGRVRANAAAAP